VRAIVTRHNGRATIRSRPGQGTLVGLQLPAGGR
jgi:signal transduction histidine kinase